MNSSALSAWFNLSDNTRKNIFNEISNKTGLPAAAAEKDWWVVRTLDIIFNMDISSHTVFKGGTSLSKAWGLIDRFSEDIDLALDKKFLGIEKIENNSQLKKLRKKSFKFISEKFYPDLQSAFTTSGFNVNIKKEEEIENDQDPIVIEIHYPGVTEQLEYLPSRVLIEIGSRSLMEPHTQRSFCSFVGEYFDNMNFADKKINNSNCKS